MDRKDLITKLSEAAPKIVGKGFSDDMGYEFTALHSDGVVFAEPGMLTDVSGGRLPPDDDLIKFVDEEYFEITPWDEVDDEDLEYFVENLKS